MKTINPDTLKKSLHRALEWHTSTQDGTYDHRACIAIYNEIIGAIDDATEEIQPPPQP